MSGPFKIGVLAERCHVSPHAIRFYEREALLPRPSRTPSGHRLYDEGSVRRLQFIRRGQKLGLTLEDVRALLESRGSGPRSIRRQVATRLSRRLTEVGQRISVLQVTRRHLVRALKMCAGGRPPVPASELALVEAYLRDGVSQGA